jgi:murein DD-endopeptidase MepM/ murein hydrolase activator NlpD
MCRWLTFVSLPLLALLLSGAPRPTGSSTDPASAPRRAATQGLPSLRTAPAAPRQGQAVFVTNEGIPGATMVRMTWDGKPYPIYALGSEWRGVIPLKIEESTSLHTVRLAYVDAAGKRRILEKRVTVGRTPLRVQHLSMSRRTERLYSYPGRAKELATVRKALLTETAHQLWDGSFALPTRGRFSTPFGVKRIRNGRPVGYHRGLDIAAPAGTPVHAAAAGRVVLARTLTMHGKTVVIDHGLGVTSLYLHQSALRCHEGQAVQRGDRIGDVGMTGVATGPHLHWSIYVHGMSVSPLFWTRLPR